MPIRASKSILILILSIVFLTACQQSSTIIEEKSLNSEGVEVFFPELQISNLKDDSQEEIYQKINKIFYDRVLNIKEELKGEAKDYTYMENYQVTYNQYNILSLRFDGHLNLKESPHPINLMDSITLNLKNGHIYSLEGLFKEGVDYRKRLNHLARKEILNSNIPLLREFKGITEDQSFYLREGLLVLYYQEYFYTPHAYGPLLIKIPLKSIADILSEEVV